MRRALLQAACAGPLLLAAFTPCGYSAQSEQVGELHFSAVRDGSLIRVSASVELAADAALAWQVLTDYDHYADFISGLSQSRVVARNADGLVLEQRGDLGIMFFKQSVQTRMLVTEVPPTTVLSRGIEGSFKDLTGRYELQPASTGLRLAYSGSFVPDFFLPPLVGMAIVRYALERNFAQLAAEIIRRAGTRK